MGFLGEDAPRAVFTPNPEMVMLAQKDDEFKGILNSADLLVPDGIGIVKASRLTPSKIKERVPGIELVASIFEREEAKDATWYFLGGRPDVAEMAKTKLQANHPHLKVVGCHHGYFAEDEEEVIARNIAETNADIVLVGLGFPRQERFINKYKSTIGAKVLVGVGGSFDVFSENLKRAPKIFRKMGMEWLYRLLRQPSRIWRQRVLVKFAFKVIISKLRGTL